ncbi:MAG TPA: fibronectin type III domain-containing protein [Solirubrobacterales bacterium]|nr:fibronectin type III domain-containing protein [Solirubrobacterales bacterium]
MTLVATNAGGPASAGPESFATETTAPEVLSQKAFPTATEATLQAQVNPGGLETSYFFEYGPTASYGQSTPVKTLKAGGEPVTASAPVFGLQPSTTYHFRVVTSNSAGTDDGDDANFTTPASGPASGACSNEAIRIAQRAEFMPQCRAYEMVSPADKNGHGVEVRNAALGGLSVSPAVSTDGERVLYGAQTAYADAQGGMPISYLAQRTQSGWGSVAVSPRVTLKSALAVEPGLLSRVTMSNPSLTAFFGDTRQPLVPEDTDAVSTCQPEIADFEPCGLDMYQFGPNQRADLLSQGEGGVQTPREVQPGEGISEDGSHAFFLSGAALVSGDSERAANAWDVYERSGGVTRPLNRTTAGDAMVNRCGSKLARVAAETEPASPISADGSRVVFQVPNGFEGDPDCGIPQRLYVRVDDSKTLFVNESQRSEPDPAGLRPAEFLQMSRDGSDIYFNSEEMLTDDATPGGGLYHFDVDSGELQLLLGSVEFPGEVNFGFLKVAPDGSKAYFGNFSPPPPGEGEAGESFLYEWDGDAVHWVASSPSFHLGGVDINTSRKLSADNRYLRLVTSAQLTAFDNEGFRAVYLYDSVERALTCVSCDPAGQRPVGSQPRSSAIVEAAPVLDNGSLVLESGDQLVAADTNLRRDVYEFRDGRLHLLSAGSSSNDVFLFGQSADGRDVFLATNQRLTLSDRDHALDIFDARAGGGFVEQSAPPPDACQGDGCQGPAASAPAPRQAGSAGLNGPGNQKARRKQRCPKGKHRKKARNGSKARCVKNKSSQHNSRKGR